MVLTSFETIHFPLMLERAKDILLAPLANTDMLWMVIPLLITLFAMETYFGRYVDDELGWNTALGNALVLLFVSMDLFRTLIAKLPTPHTAAQVVRSLPQPEFALALLVGLGGIYLIFTDFFRILPKQIAFNISSAFPINFIAYASLVVIYTDISLDWHTLLGALLLFGMLAMFFWYFRLIIPYANTARKQEG
ncbi:MAG TPA: hypothetical protein VJK52_04300 [Candidatus Nanoarchaeia archaeon]|nr:hypothetical protein [Candidatus Nanoarchaeia archaeon]